MEIPNRQERQRSFGQVAELYDRVRPRYPAEALRWALGAGPARVVDLGAGTGILTRLLVELGHRVVAVEPDTAMLDRLRAVAPEADARQGTAEEIPLPDAVADAVVAGQAYHWFDTRRAHPEVARVLRPGGVFAPLWNIRDESVAWVAALTAIVGGEDGGTRRPDEDFGPWFGPIERATFRHAVEHDVDTLLDLVRSRSYYLVASPERRAELEREIRALVATHPDLAGRATFDLPYRTDVFRAHRR